MVIKPRTFRRYSATWLRRADWFGLECETYTTQGYDGVAFSPYISGTRAFYIWSTNGWISPVLGIYLNFLLSFLFATFILTCSLPQTTSLPPSFTQPHNYFDPYLYSQRSSSTHLRCFGARLYSNKQYFILILTVFVQLPYHSVRQRFLTFGT